jgi:hypothetical protein
MTRTSEFIAPVPNSQMAKPQKTGRSTAVFSARRSFDRASSEREKMQAIIKILILTRNVRHCTIPERHFGIFDLRILRIVRYAQKFVAEVALTRSLRENHHGKGRRTNGRDRNR